MKKIKMMNLLEAFKNGFICFVLSSLGCFFWSFYLDGVKEIFFAVASTSFVIGFLFRLFLLLKMFNDGDLRIDDRTCVVQFKISLSEIDERDVVHLRVIHADEKDSRYDLPGAS